MYFSTTESEAFMRDLENVAVDHQKSRFIQVFRNHYNMKRKMDLTRAHNMLVLRLQRKLARIADESQTGGF